MQPYYPIPTTYPEFRRVHTTEDAPLLRDCDDDRYFLAPDGASVLAANAEDRREPPTDPAERYRLTLQYQKTRLKAAEKEFNDARQNIANQQSLSAIYSNLPPVESGAVEFLKQLKAKVERYRAEYQEQLAHPQETASQRVSRIQREIEAQQQNSRESLLRDIASVKL